MMSKRYINHVNTTTNPGPGDYDSTDKKNRALIDEQRPHVDRYAHALITALEDKFPNTNIEITVTDECGPPDILCSYNIDADDVREVLNRVGIYNNFTH